ncbi:MAG: hypothetical protein GY847_14400 [Proteobacteria bacterium]|nr:hypothetical protein [Pseudomonadota bacterium]
MTKCKKCHMWTTARQKPGREQCHGNPVDECDTCGRMKPSRSGEIRGEQYRGEIDAQRF